MYRAERISRANSSSEQYKEKGDESGLHIIIFDELDAICKQRGSGAGGGTGVGDSVVNQLLSKVRSRSLVIAGAYNTLRWMVSTN